MRLEGGWDGVPLRLSSCSVCGGEDRRILVDELRGVEAIVVQANTEIR